MIIGKEIIDVQVSAKKAAMEARDNELLKAILANVKKLKALRRDVRDIMETFFYIQKVDADAAKKMWHAMCRTIPEPLGITLCNGLTREGWETKYAFRPDISRKDCYNEVYVATANVYFSPVGKWDKLQPICDIEAMLPTERYEATLNSMILLINAIPAYKEQLTKMIPEFIKKED